MKSRAAIFASTLGLVLLGARPATFGAPPPRTPPVRALMVGFERMIDLETGRDCGSVDGLPGVVDQCTAPPDLVFAFNANNPNPTVLFQQYSAQIAMLQNVPFAAVDSAAVANGIVFTEELQDVPFGPNDTAIIRTAEGNYFKVGLALCFYPDPGYPGCALVGPTGAYGVRFQYQQIG